MKPRHLNGFWCLTWMCVWIACSEKDKDMRSSGGIHSGSSTPSAGEYTELKIELAELKDGLPEDKSLVQTATSSALLVLDKKDVSLINTEGVTAVGKIPEFYLSADKLFYTVASVDDKNAVGVWFFYDDTNDSDPKFENALPMFVNNEGIVDRPSLTDSNWKMPNKDELGIGFASTSVLWIFDKKNLFYILREGGQWKISKVSLEESDSPKLLSSSESSAVFLMDDKVKIFAFKDGEVKAKTVSLPGNIITRKLMFLAMEKIFVVSGKDSVSYYLDDGKSEWLKVELPDAAKGVFGVKSVSLARVFPESAYLVFSDFDVAFNVTIKQVVVATEKKKFSDHFSKVRDIFNRSCSDCHNKASSAPTYVGSEFDYQSEAHWQYFLSAGKYGSLSKAYDKIINDMCERDTKSLCSSKNAEGQAQVKEFIRAVFPTH